MLRKCNIIFVFTIKSTGSAFEGAILRSIKTIGNCLLVYVQYMYMYLAALFFSWCYSCVGNIINPVELLYFYVQQDNNTR